MMKRNNNQQNSNNTNKQQLSLENRNGKIRNDKELSTPWAEDGYSNEATQVDHLLIDKATKPKVHPKTEVKQKMLSTRDGIRKAIWCYMHWTK
jgi:hypothetical protein